MGTHGACGTVQLVKVQPGGLSCQYRMSLTVVQQWLLKPLLRDCCVGA